VSGVAATRPSRSAPSDTARPFNLNTISQGVINCANPAIVTKIADTNDGVCDADCSLREALVAVCPGGTITFDTAGVFATPQTITLTVAELSVTQNVTVDAPDAAGNHVTVTGNNASRVFNINSGNTVTLRDLTIAGGSNAGNGGGIFNDHGALTLINVTVSGSTAGNGGGIYSDGTTSGSASLTIINSTVSGNTSTNTAGVVGGGGIYANGTSGSSEVKLTNSTVSGNFANNHSGGIYVVSSTTTLTNATITNNHADNDDSGVGAAGGLSPNGGTLTLHNTIVAGNFRGSGTTIINGEPFHWEKGDTFVVPLWSWHEHANRSNKDEAILFSMHDSPILKAFGLYREEGKEDSAQKI
jgi:CSLREA domain-containing protein